VTSGLQYYFAMSYLRWVFLA